jgi:hypothetical protein
MYLLTSGSLNNLVVWKVTDTERLDNGAVPDVAVGQYIASQTLQEPPDNPQVACSLWNSRASAVVAFAAAVSGFAAAISAFATAIFAFAATISAFAAANSACAAAKVDFVSAFVAAIYTFAAPVFMLLLLQFCLC